MSNPNTPIDVARPELHLTAEAGALYAPAAALVDGTTWHLFHQYRLAKDAPYQPTSPARWGHQISQDNCFDWEECDDVLAPEGEELLVRAGAVLPTDDGGAYLYFTSVRPSGTSIHLAQLHNLADSAVEVSDDPLALDQGVTRIGEVVGDAHGEGLTDFRSPSVVRGWVDTSDRGAGHAGYLMLAVAGPMESPRLALLTSPDGVKWSLLGPLTFQGTTGLEDQADHIVSPRIARLRDEVDGKIYDVLMVTVEADGVDISGYLVGTMEDATFTVVRPFQRFDYGHDFTRPRSATYTSDSPQRPQHYESAVIIGLLNGVGRLDDPGQHYSMRTEGWANALSLPRQVTLQGGTLYQTPMDKLIYRISQSQKVHASTVLAEMGADARILFEIKDINDKVAATITHDGTTLTIDRSMNPLHAGDAPASAPIPQVEGEDGMHAITVIVDGSTVEVFAAGGAVAMASRVYIDGGITDIRLRTSGEVTLDQSFAVAPDQLISHLD